MPDRDGPVADGLVAGRFRLLGRLGSGATASVYEAVDGATGARVAVKILHPHLSHAAASRDAFLREARTVAGIRHPALCSVVGAGVEDDGVTGVAPQTWTAWEIAPGRTLAEHVRERGPLPPAAAVDVATRVLDGLAALHAVGLVHRDISPSNVVIDLGADGRLRDARVIDFGLVDRDGMSTRGRDVLRSEAADDEDGVVGNVRYAAPELLRGEGVGPAADLYQLAGVLYFALVGAPPFPRATTEETIRAHQTAAPPTASVRVRGMPIALDRAIVRAMLKDPAARFVSAGEMRDALAAAIARPAAGSSEAPAQTTRTRVLPGPTDAGPVPPESEAAGPERGSSPWLWAAGLGAAALVAAVVVALTPGGPTIGATATPTPSAAATSPAPEPASPAPRASVTDAAPVHAEVPSLEGAGLDEARRLIESAGLVVGEVREADSARTGGTVLASEPPPGSVVARGHAIGLTVASGSNVVPELIGAAEQTAIDAALSAGFTPVVVREASAASPGTVVSLQPPPSARVHLGTSVVISVAVPVTTPTPQPTSATPSPISTPTPGITP